MPDWALAIIIGFGSAGTAIGTFLGYMKANGKNPVNGIKRQEFTDQVNLCNERFIKEAKTNGIVKTSLKNIERRLENIEGWLKR